MIIARYIGDLLYDYECVVIPGFGGFIVNDKPAKVNYSTHYLTPPFREVMFNPYLRTNDGLLLNYIAKEEEITYHEAKRKVDAFAMLCQRALDNGKQIRFEKIGTIRQNDNGKIIFNQDTSINYNPNSFGLSSFISPAVHQSTEEERLKKAINKVIVEKENVPSKPKESTKRKDKRIDTKKSNKGTSGERIIVSKRRSPYRNQLYFVLFLLVAMLIGWGVMNKKIVTEYYALYGSKVPVFYGNPGSYIANNVEIIPLKELSKSTSTLWLAKFFKKNKNNKSSLSNDNLTFKADSKTDKNANVKSDIADEENIITPESDTKENTNIAPPQTDKPEENTDYEKNSNISSASSTSNIDNTTPASTIEETNTHYKEVSTNQPITPNPVSDLPAELTEPFSYFIIAGSFKSHNNAVKLVKQLQSEGFDALIAGVNQYGMTRVAYAGFRTRQEAIHQLSLIRQQNNPSAWIMKN